MAVMTELKRDNQFFLENPFYLEFSKEDFRKVLQIIPQDHFDNGKRLLENYIKTMEEDEEKILEKIVGNTQLDKQKVLESLFKGVIDVDEAMKYLDNLFARDYGKVSISKEKNTNNYFMKLLGAKLDLVKEGDNYDFEKTIENANPKQLEEFQEKLNIFVETITAGFKTEEEMKADIYKLLDKNLLTTKTSEEGGWDRIKAFINSMKDYNGTLSSQFLEFLKSTIGTYSYLRGLFSEAALAHYSPELLKDFEGFIEKRRGDQSTGKNKKPDIIIEAKILANPITISQKVIKSESSIKLQGSSVANVRRNFYMKEDLILANIYSYLILNESFYPDLDAQKKIQLINNYLSYVLISGLSTDIPVDRAVYLVFTKNETTRLIPISAILKEILKNKIDVGMGKPIRGTEEEKEKIFGIKNLDKETIKNTIQENTYKQHRSEMQNYFEELAERKIQLQYDKKYFYADHLNENSEYYNNPKIEVSKFIAESITPLKKERNFVINIKKLEGIEKGIILKGPKK